MGMQVDTNSNTDAMQPQQVNVQQNQQQALQTQAQQNLVQAEQQDAAPNIDGAFEAGYNENSSKSGLGAAQAPQTNGQAYQSYLDNGLVFTQAEKFSGWESPPPVKHYLDWQALYDNPAVIDQDTGALVSRDISDAGVAGETLAAFEAERAQVLGLQAGQGYAGLADSMAADDEAYADLGSNTSKFLEKNEKGKGKSSYIVGIEHAAYKPTQEIVNAQRVNEYIKRL